MLECGGHVRRWHEAEASVHAWLLLLLAGEPTRRVLDTSAHDPQRTSYDVRGARSCAAPCAELVGHGLANNGINTLSLRAKWIAVAAIGPEVQGTQHLTVQLGGR